jgi:hypothetical protein
LLWVTGLPGLIHRANADQVQLFSDTLSTSAPNTNANHTISFATPTGVPADGSTIELSIPAGFDMSTLEEDDIDIADDGIDLSTGDTCGAVAAAVSTSSQTITIEICSGGGGAIAAASTVTIEIGTNATSSGTGAGQITNHATPGDYALTLGGTMADEGVTRIVVVEGVTITGAVDSFLSFTISGVDFGETVNADLTSITGTSTATTVPFGAVAPLTEYVMAQDLAATTNTVNGFTVTVSARSDLTSGGGSTIDSFTDGTATSTPVVWQAPSGQSGDTDTYGHWGVTTEDVSLSDDDSFGDALYAGDFIDNPREVMYSTTSADGSTAHIGTTRVGYKLEITALQEAGTDYQTELVYVITPVF